MFIHFSTYSMFLSTNILEFSKVNVFAFNMADVIQEQMTKQFIDVKKHLFEGRVRNKLV